MAAMRRKKATRRREGRKGERSACPGAIKYRYRKERGEQGRIALWGNTMDSSEPYSTLVIRTAGMTPRLILQLSLALPPILLPVPRLCTT